MLRWSQRVVYHVAKAASLLVHRIGHKDRGVDRVHHLGVRWTNKASFAQHIHRLAQVTVLCSATGRLLWTRRFRVIIIIVATSIRMHRITTLGSTTVLIRARRLLILLVVTNFRSNSRHFRFVSVIYF